VILFRVFGFVVNTTNRRIWTRLYNEGLKLSVDNYLLSMNYSRYDFDHAADETLQKDTRLRAFLFKP
jgi:hypothetical protein